jgi:hypothetical protein
MMRSAVVPVVILGACALASGALLAQGPRNIEPLSIEDATTLFVEFSGGIPLDRLTIKQVRGKYVGVASKN